MLTHQNIIVELTIVYMSYSIESISSHLVSGTKVDPSLAKRELVSKNLLVANVC